MSHFPYPPVPPAAHVPPPPLRARPGLVSALGVCSIIVAGLSLVACLVYGVYVFGVRHIGQYAASRAQSVTLASAGTGARPTGSAAAAAGLPSPEELDRQARRDRDRLAGRRDALVALLNGVHEMAPTQQAQLGAMLGRHADRIVPPDLFAAGDLSAGDVQAWVTRAGALPAERPGEPEPVYFETKAGRLEVFADRAVFRPGDGKPNLRTAAPDGVAGVEGLRFTLATDRPTPATATSGDPTAGPTTRGVGPFYRSGLNRQQIDQAIAGIQAAAGSMNGGRQLNPAQVAALRTELQTVPLVTPQTAYQPVQLVNLQPDGSAHLNLSNGMLLLDPAGVVQMRVANAFHQVTLDPVAGTLLVGDLAASVLSAVLLLVSGILTLRNSPRAAGLHWVYALVKLPLAVLGALSFAWVMADLTDGFTRLQGGRGTSGGLTAFGAVMGVVAAAYPVVLMIVLSTPTVREFYAAERGRRR